MNNMIERKGEIDDIERGKIIVGEKLLWGWEG